MVLKHDFDDRWLMGHHTYAAHLYSTIISFMKKLEELIPK